MMRGRHLELIQTDYQSFSNIRDLAITPGGDFVFASNGYVYVEEKNRWYEMRGGSSPNGGEIDGLEYLPKQKIVRYFTFGVGVLDFVLLD